MNFDFCRRAYYDVSILSGLMVTCTLQCTPLESGVERNFKHIEIWHEWSQFGKKNLRSGIHNNRNNRFANFKT